MKKYAIGLYEKAMPDALTWREKLAFAKEAGYDFVEISIDEKDAKLARLNWTKEERLELVRPHAERPEQPRHRIGLLRQEKAQHQGAEGEAQESETAE